MNNVKAVAESDSVEENLDAVKEAFDAQFNPQLVEAMPVMPCIEETYADFVIVCEGEQYYRVPFTQVADGVQFAPREQWIPVQEQWVDMPADAMKAGARHSKSDKATIAQIKAKARQIQSHAKALDPARPAYAKASGIDGIAYNTPAIAIKTAGDYELDVCYMPYNGQNNGKDADGEFFTPATKEYSERFPTPLVLYYHGYEAPGRPAAEPVEIGTSGNRWQDKAGRWIRVKLDKTVKEAVKVWNSAQKGNARASSDSIAHLVRKKSTGELTHWAFVGISLFETETGKRPANSYAFALPAAKALGIQNIPDSLEDGDPITETQQLSEITAAIVAAALMQK